MNIIKRELLGSRKAFLIWSIGLICLLLVGFAKTSGMAGGQSMTELIETLPATLQAIFSTGLNLDTGLGVFSVLYLYLCFALSFHGGILGAQTFTREETDGTFEFLYIKGVKRSSILASKVMACILLMLGLNLVAYAAGGAGLQLIMNDSSALIEILPLMAGLFLIQLTFFALGLILSFLIPKHKASLVLSMTVLVTFILSMASSMSPNLSWLKWLTPFQYFNATAIVQEGFPILYAGLFLVLIVILTAFAFERHQKRDLK